MSKPNKKGRAHEARHIRLYHRMTGSPAWRAASGNAIKVIVALARLDNGERNGDLYFSVRKASDETGLSIKTCAKALSELEKLGFIASTERGHFSRKGGPATKWRLTWIAWPGHQGPTNDYEKWQPETPDCNKLRWQNFPEMVVDSTTVPEISLCAVAKNTTTELAKPQSAVISGVVKTTTQLGIPSGIEFQDACNALRNEVRAWLADNATRQKQLARMAGLSEPKLSRFLDLNGSRTLSVDQFNRLASIIRDHPKKSAAA